jgi:multiple sugar transport system ATP-binding protein
MAGVDVVSVKKSYGSVPIIHGIDLSIADGSFVVLLGPSGCGKSTLLRMIAGLEAITEGDIRIGGQVVNNVHPKDRNIAMVFQNYALYAHMKVRDNMAFSMALKKRPQAEIDEKVKWAARILNLEPYLDRYPKELSGGQRQRVAMGRAIVRNPEVFLFDEPLSNLDAKLRVQMRTEIKDLHQRLKTTTIYVTHDQIEAMTMADTIVILRDGVIEQMGRPLEVYDRPNNLFVAGFIGSPAMNLIKGVVENDVVRFADGSSVPVPDGRKVDTGRKVVYGVRPEHLRPVRGGAGSPIRAKAEILEPTGPELHIYCTMGGEEVCAVTSERLMLAAGDDIGLNPDGAHAHLFDAESGKAIFGA